MSPVLQGQSGYNCPMSQHKQPYHHGDLKQTLVTHAAERLRSGGMAALSLRKIASDAGVNHTAAYAHFPTKDALIAAVLGWGYDRLAERLDGCVDTTDEAMSRLVQASLAYHAFSLDETHLFFAMVGPRINADNAYPDLEASLARAYQYIEGPIADVQTDYPLGLATAPIFWASLQGLLSQLLTGRIRVLPDDQPQLVEQFARSISRGFGIDRT